MGRKHHSQKPRRSRRWNIIRGILLSLVVFCVFILFPVVYSVLQAIEAYAQEQIELIARDNLGPKLSFDDLEYHFPYSIAMINPKLSSDDVVIMSADQIEITLAEIPRSGKPVLLQDVIFSKLKIRIQENKEGVIVGYSNFIVDNGQLLDDGGSTKPSDFLRMRSVDINDGIFEYANASGRVMDLDQINLVIDASLDESQPGLYRFNSSVKRVGVFELLLKGAINLDSGMTRLREVTLSSTIEKGEYHVLPPGIQATLEAWEVYGNLTITLSGVIPLKELKAINLNSKVLLLNAGFSIDRFALPVSRLAIEMQFRDKVFSISPMRMNLLGGILEFRSRFNLTAPKHFSAELYIMNLLIQDALKSAGDKDPDYAGVLDLSVMASADVDHFEYTLAGQGGISVEHGKLLTLPLIDPLFRNIGSSDVSDGMNDSASASIKLGGLGVQLSNVLLSGAGLAARGQGVMLFDGNLDFRFNGGPLEAVESSLGSVGSLMGKVTDRIVTYRVFGTFKSPVFVPIPLGIGVPRLPLILPQSPVDGGPKEQAVEPSHVPPVKTDESSDAKDG